MSIILDADAGPPTDNEWLCLECGQWTPWRHEEAHDHADGCKAPAIYAAKRDWKTRLKDYMAKWGIPAGAGEPDAVAYLDIGTGYLDLETALSEEALLRLLKGRHVLVIAGTYGIDGYAPTPQPTQPQAGAVPLTCEWTHNEDDGFWETACGEAWRFDDGGPGENNMHFCHSCGNSLRIKGENHDR